MKRILMLNYEFPPLGGGASPVSYEIAKGYVKLGHSVTVVTMSFKGLKKYEKIDGIDVYRVPCLRSKKEICHPHEMLSYVISAKRFLREHLKKNKYDINHTHFIIPTGIVSLWLKKKYDIPYIITSHGSDVPGHNSDRFKFMHYFTKFILKNICKNAKEITTPSNFLRDLIIKNIDYKLNNKIIPLPNGSKDLHKKQIKKEDIIMSCGRIHKGKGFQYLIRAFNELKLKNWKLYIVGEGPYKKELERISKNNKNIIFTGWIKNDSNEFISIINKAKIFSLLSEFESQGIAYIEAMSAGCAILASNITACRETVTNDIGFLVNRKNNLEIRNKLRILIENNNQLKRLMHNSRRRYEENYIWANIMKKYEWRLINKWK